jgi:hypothetical protein
MVENVSGSRLPPSSRVVDSKIIKTSRRPERSALVRSEKSIFMKKSTFMKSDRGNMSASTAKSPWRDHLSVFPELHGVFKVLVT